MLPSFFWRKLLVRTGMAGWMPSIKRLLGGGERYLHYLSDQALAAPIDELLDPAWFPEVQLPDAINLAMSSPRCELPVGSIRGVNDRRALSAWGLAELRDEIAARRQRELPAAGSDDEILVTHGASGAFAAAIGAFVDPGSKVVLFDPCSPLFILGMKNRRARIRWVDTRLENGTIRFDHESFAAAMRGARLLVFAQPANPTGGVFAAADLEQIAWWARKHDVLIYLDESFGHFCYEKPEAMLAELPPAQNRLLSAGSVSKSHGLNTARVGWLCGCRHLVRPCAVTASMAAPFVSPLCQEIALAALRDGEPTAARVRDEFAGRRRYLVESLQGMGLPPAWPAGGYFCWIPVNRWGLTGREFARQLLLAQRVLVNAGEAFGPGGEDFIRLSFATEEGRLREGLQRLSAFMEELRQRRADEPSLAESARYRLHMSRPAAGDIAGRPAP